MRRLWTTEKVSRSCSGSAPQGEFQALLIGGAVPRSDVWVPVGGCGSAQILGMVHVFAHILWANVELEGPKAYCVSGALL
jgi:hypothetical protein